MKGWLANLLARRADARLRRDHPDWAKAMTVECENLADENERLSWAAGCVAASYRTPRAAAGLGYAAALAAGLLAMTAMQWSQDEGLATVGVLSAIALLLGFISPRWFVVSGLAVGAVVAAVNGFEAVTGIQPDYESTQRSLPHCLRWLVLLGPALLASTTGREAGRRLRI